MNLMPFFIEKTVGCLLKTVCQCIPSDLLPASEQIANWNGRTYVYIVGGALALTGAIIGGLAAFAPAGGVTLPNWLLSAVSVIILVGASYLYNYASSTEFQDQSLRNQLKQVEEMTSILTDDIHSLKEKSIEMKQKRDLERHAQSHVNMLVGLTDELEKVANQPETYDINELKNKLESHKEFGKESDAFIKETEEYIRENQAILRANQEYVRAMTNQPYVTCQREQKNSEDREIPQPLKQRWR